MEPSIFEFTHVSFAYQGIHPALSDVSLEIRSRQRLACLGANGSGKSTLLKLLGGLLVAQQGDVRFLGQPLTDATLRDPEFNRFFRTKVGLVFQNSHAQLFSSTVWEEIAFGPLQLGLPKATVEQRVQDLLRLLRIERLRDRSPEQLSGGEQKRVAIAAVLASNPDILLMDEPTATLDPRSRWELVDLLVELQAMGKTVVTATNDLEIVPLIAEELYILDERKTILAAGATPVLLGNEAVLEQANLIHVHTHTHRQTQHRHPHQHPAILPEHHPGSSSA